MLALFYSLLLETQDAYGRCTVANTCTERPAFRFPTRAAYLNALLQAARIW